METYFLLYREGKGEAAAILLQYLSVWSKRLLFWSFRLSFMPQRLGLHGGKGLLNQPNRWHKKGQQGKVRLVFVFPKFSGNVWGLFAHTSSKLLLFSAFLVFCLPQGLWADTIYLKDGSKRVGKIISQTRKQIRIRTVDGSLWVVPKSNVRKLLFGKVDMAELREEERRKREAMLRRQREEEHRQEQRKRQERLRREKEEALRKEQERKEKEARHKKETLRRQGEEQIAAANRLDALWRSAVLPGWGQYYAGHTHKAAAFGTGFGLGVFALYDTNRLYLAAKADYANFGLPWGLALVPAAVVRGEVLALYLYREPFLQKKALMERRFGNVQAAAYLLAGVYLWNLADAWFFGGSLVGSKAPFSGDFSFHLGLGRRSSLPFGNAREKSSGAYAYGADSLALGSGYLEFLFFF